MCSTDYVLVTDKAFKKHAKAYAANEELFFKEWVYFSSIEIAPFTPYSFSIAVARLFELGVPTEQFKSDPWFLKTLNEQEEEQKK